jgi:hypothetical protein
VNALIKYFRHEHLPERLAAMSRPLCDVARLMDECLPESAEKTAGMRKLLEAKDCFVRATLDADAQVPGGPVGD